MLGLKTCAFLIYYSVFCVLTLLSPEKSTSEKARQSKNKKQNKTMRNSGIYKEKKKCVKNLPRNLGCMQEIKPESTKAGGAETGNFYPMEHQLDQRGSPGSK